MKRVFGLMLALMVCVGNVFTAYAEVQGEVICPDGWTAHVEATQYLTNFDLNTETGDLTFKDNYFPAEELRRVYEVRAYRLFGECPFEVRQDAFEGTTSYYYGGGANPLINGGTDLIHIGSYFVESAGGIHTYNISQVLDVCREKGFSRGYLVLKPMVNSHTGGIYGSATSYYNNKNEDKYESRQGLWLVNGFYFELETVSDASITVPTTARYNRTDQHYQLAFKCMNRCRYMVESSSDNVNWKNEGEWIAEADEARKGVSKETFFTADQLNAEKLWFRLVVENLETGSSKVVNAANPVEVSYPLVQGSNETWHKKGETVMITKNDACKALEFRSQLPVKMQVTDDPLKVKITMPGCYVQVLQKTAVYTVKFLNADYTLLKSEQVTCGGNATAPANPSYGGFTFKGWDKDYTNVQKDLNVMAKYAIGSDEYSLSVILGTHKNERYPYDRFATYDNRAMVGDVLTFGIHVEATANASLYYETGSWNMTEKKWSWSDGKKIGDYTAGNSTNFSQTLDVCWDAINGVRSLESRFAVRFYLLLAGNKLYADPYELDVFYPITVASQSANSLLVENETGQFEMNFTVTIPARMNDTIRVYNVDGEGGGCFQYARVNKPQPQYAVVSGLDKAGNSFFLCPGEIETIKTSTAQYAVLFDNAYPQHNYDFTAQGLGNYNNVFYAEVVTCGGSVQHMPANPVMEGYLFKGWKAWDSKIADDAYMKVPAVDGVFVGFSADWGDIPTGEQFIVRFFKKDGKTQIGLDQLVNRGENATAPEAPAEAGFHFAGWDKDFTNVTANLDVVALYGDDSKSWTVAYYDEEGQTKLKEEVVADMMPANGLSLYKEGNEFVGWKNMSTGTMEDLSHVSKDLNVKAVFQIKQAIEQVASSAPNGECRKVLVGGKIYLVLRDGKVYTVTGVRVR